MINKAIYPLVQIYFCWSPRQSRSGKPLKHPVLCNGSQKLTTYLRSLKAAATIN